MYLTAQCVLSQDGQTGINAFFHLHRPGKQPKPSSNSEVVFVAESNTGKLIKDHCDIKPGGNRVKSYLDIVATDTIDEKAINAALDKFQLEIVQDKMGPIISIVDGIGFRFNAETGLFKSLDDEFSALRKRAVFLFHRGSFLGHKPG
jgi:hypothetical protein